MTTDLTAIEVLRKPQRGKPLHRLAVDKAALKKLRLVVVAYSHVKVAWFPTQEAYEAEVEVEQRAKEVVAALRKLGVKAKAYRADRYFMAKLLVDQPDLVLNLVDTLRGSDALQTSIPGALELAGRFLHRRGDARPGNRQRPQPGQGGARRERHPDAALPVRDASRHAHSR